MRRDEAARRNRDAMPFTAREVDGWRRVFGPETRVTWAREGDAEVGRRQPEGRSMNADEWLRYVRTGETC